MLDRPAAARYAHALFQIAREARIDAEVETAVLELSAALRKSPGTERTLGDPRLGLAEKRRMFSLALAGAGEKEAALLLNFVSVLFEKGRFPLIHDIAEAYKAIADEAQGESVVVVRTAQPLDAASESRMQAELEKRTGTKVFMKKEVDPAVLGGVQVRIGNRLIDGSVQGGLSRMKEELLRRN